MPIIQCSCTSTRPAVSVLQQRKESLHAKLKTSNPPQKSIMLQFLPQITCSDLTLHSGKPSNSFHYHFFSQDICLEL